MVDSLVCPAGKPGAVERQVPDQLVADRPLARVGPVEQHHPAVGRRAEVAELPVAVEERLRRGEHRRRTAGTGRAAARRIGVADVGRRPGGEALPPLRRRCGAPPRGSRAPPRPRAAGCRTTPSAARCGSSSRSSVHPHSGGGQRGDAVEEPEVGASVTGSSPTGTSCGPTSRMRRAAPHPLRPPGRGAEGGVVDALGRDVHQPGRPHPAGPAADVARHPHREVAGRVARTSRGTARRPPRPARTRPTSGRRRAGGHRAGGRPPSSSSTEAATGRGTSGTGTPPSSPVC